MQAPPRPTHPIKRGDRKRERERKRRRREGGGKGIQDTVCQVRAPLTAFNPELFTCFWSFHLDVAFVVVNTGNPFSKA